MPFVYEDDVQDETNFIVQVPGEPKRKCIDGKLWPSIVQAEHLRSAKSYQPDEDDVFVVTFPKCGTTWTQNICMKLLHSDYTPEQGKELYNASPMIEVRGAEMVRNTPRPRVIKTHMSYADAPKGIGVRYILVARNPKDVCVSYYFHHKSIEAIYDWKDGTFEHFFQMFFAGKLEFGDYFDYLREWMAHSEEGNMLVLKYEEMLADLPTEVKRIATFLGAEAEKAVASSTQLDRIVRSCSFDEMSKEQERFFPVDNANHSFFRKGQKKDWLNYFTKEQSDQVDQMWKERMKGTAMENWWTEEMKFEPRKQ